MNYVSYYRVSTRHQGHDGNGMHAQRDAVTRWVASQKGTVLEEFSEVESGGRCDRPQLNAALEHCRRTKATLVVAKLDRLSRNAEFLLRLQNAGVNFVCCDCPNVDRFTVGILALVAQRERELISERTCAALQAAKARGVRLGTRNPQRQCQLMVQANAKAHREFVAGLLPVIREIQNTGATTLQSIADCLSRRGIATRTGRSNWYPTQVRNILQTAGKDTFMPKSATSSNSSN
jgi:hypothetical protein